TYTVEIITDNPKGRLLPYLTANVKFELQRLDNILMIPKAALRWNPQTEQIAPDLRKSLDQPGSKTNRASAGMDQNIVWAVQGQYVRPILVRTGLSDGIMTQIQGKDLSVGLAVVTGIRDQNTASADTKNPFTPQFLRRNRSQGSSTPSDRTGAK
ncbi:MAG: hypothetical protein WB792_07865, partial [Desulfobacterales bacterium]